LATAGAGEGDGQLEGNGGLATAPPAAAGFAEDEPPAAPEAAGLTALDATADGFAAAAAEEGAAAEDEAAGAALPPQAANAKVAPMATNLRGLSANPDKRYAPSISPRSAAA